MLDYNDLKIGAIFLYEGEPYEVQEYSFLRMQQRKPVAQTKIINLVNGKIIKYIYQSRGECWFCAIDDPKNRFALKSEIVGSAAQFLKANTQVIAMKWGERIIRIQVPVKMDLLIKETPPGERGNTAQGGTKIAELETGAKIPVPLFVNTGDVIRVNTTTGEYTERVEKGVQ
jgi:elongation factor P